MAPRVKKLLGVSLLLPALGAYLFAAAVIGAEIPSRWYFQAPFYLAAGILWAFPTIVFIRWMERGESRKETSPDETPR